MPKYSLNYWEEGKYGIVFEADSPEHAKELLDDILDVDDLPQVEKYFKKGDVYFDIDTLAEVEEN